jgi:hypothetical protein
MIAIPSALRGRPGVDVAARAAKSALRVYGTRSAGDRPAPEFLIVGAKRGGTTSLWEYLAEHPGFLPQFPASRSKGTYFFTDFYDRGEAWWRSHFATTRTREAAERRLGYRPVTGEASPYYLFHPLAPQRIRQAAPEALIIATLRNPIERTYSHYKERRRHTESLSFEDALAAERPRTRGEEQRLIDHPEYVSFSHRHQSYVAQSMYGPMLDRWAAAFPRDQLLVFTAEEMYANPQCVVDNVTVRLGLPTRTLVDASPRNAAPSAGIDPGVRERLAGQLAPTISAVDQFLGRPTGWA